MGSFKLEPTRDKQRHIILIGGGSGITPLFSILKTTIEQESGSKVSLVYVNKNINTTIFYEELENYKLQHSERLEVIHHWSDDMREERKKEGFFSKLFGRSNKNSHRINIERLTSIFTRLKLQSVDNVEFFICGPQGLIEITEKTIDKFGFSKKSIHKESFSSSPKKENNGDGVMHHVKIILNKKEYDLEVKPNQSILFAGLDLGYDMPYSCQTGSCSACMGKCLSGKIEMSESEGLTEDQIKEGYVLTCVGYPITDNVVIKF